MKKNGVKTKDVEKEVRNIYLYLAITFFNFVVIGNWMNKVEERLTKVEKGRCTNWSSDDAIRNIEREQLERRFGITKTELNKADK